MQNVIINHMKDGLLQSGVALKLSFMETYYNLIIWRDDLCHY